MIRYILAPHIPFFARSLGIPRTLPELAAQLVASGPPAVGERPHLATQPRTVAITFDDGPHPDGTPRMLEILAQHDAHATFFLAGEQVVKRPELARRVLAEGHAIGLHGYQHRPHPSRSAAAIAEDFERATAAIGDATGIVPRLHRPPYGIYSGAGLRAARADRLRPLLWSKWGKDWRKFTTPERIAARATGEITTGDVILLHDADFYSARDSHRRTVAALPIIITELKRRELGTVLPI